jgi:hemerythrin-like metal-binding protein
MGRLNIRQLELGHKTIDREHVVICHKLAELSELNDIAGLAKLVHSITEELLEHQAKEEEQMLQLGYPALEEHTSNHQILYELYSAIEEPVIRGHIPPAVASEILGRCLALHILLEDKRFADFLVLHHPEL